MDRVNETHEEVVVTKHGRPVVRIIPVSDEASRDIFGYLKGTATINGDIISPIGDSWEADS